MKFLISFVSAILICFFLAQSASSIGMTPASREIFFEPGLFRNFSFVAIASPKDDILVRPYASGDLANYTRVPDRTYFLIAGESTGMWGEIHLPQEMTPGVHRLGFGIMEETPPVAGGYAGVVAKMGVESLLFVRVPYPSKYVELKMNIEDTALGDDAVVIMTVSNRGSLDLEDVQGFVDIISPAFERVERVAYSQGSVYIPKMETRTFTAHWNTSKHNPGDYQAIATVNYDGNVTSAKRDFRLGDLQININNFRVNDTVSGEIAKFVADLKSIWISNIPQVFNRVAIMDTDGNVVGETKGETIRMGNWGEYPLEIYWDTENTPEGDYVAEILLEYGERNNTASTTFKITNPMEIPWIYIVIILLVIFISYQFYRSRRK